MAFTVQYCPYRTKINWSSIQTTEFVRPTVFTGDSGDLDLLDACNEELVAERTAQEAADRETAEAEAAIIAEQEAAETEVRAAEALALAQYESENPPSPRISRHHSGSHHHHHRRRSSSILSNDFLDSVISLLRKDSRDFRSSSTSEVSRSSEGSRFSHTSKSPATSKDSKTSKRSKEPKERKESKSSKNPMDKPPRKMGQGRSAKKSKKADATTVVGEPLAAADVAPPPAPEAPIGVAEPVVAEESQPAVEQTPVPPQEPAPAADAVSETPAPVEPAIALDVEKSAEEADSPPETTDTSPEAEGPPTDLPADDPIEAPSAEAPPEPVQTDLPIESEPEAPQVSEDVPVEAGTCPLGEDVPESDKSPELVGITIEPQNTSNNNDVKLEEKEKSSPEQARPQEDFRGCLGGGGDNEEASPPSAAPGAMQKSQVASILVGVKSNDGDPVSDRENPPEDEHAKPEEQEEIKPNPSVTDVNVTEHVPSGVTDDVNVIEVAESKDVDHETEALGDISNADGLDEDLQQQTKFDTESVAEDIATDFVAAAASAIFPGEKPSVASMIKKFEIINSGKVLKSLVTYPVVGSVNDNPEADPKATQEEVHIPEQVTQPIIVEEVQPAIVSDNSKESPSTDNLQAVDAVAAQPEVESPDVQSLDTITEPQIIESKDVVVDDGTLAGHEGPQPTTVEDGKSTPSNNLPELPEDTSVPEGPRWSESGSTIPGTESIETAVQIPSVTDGPPISPDVDGTPSINAPATIIAADSESDSAASKVDDTETLDITVADVTDNTNATIATETQTENEGDPELSTAQADDDKSTGEVIFTELDLPQDPPEVVVEDEQAVVEINPIANSNMVEPEVVSVDVEGNVAEPSEVPKVEPLIEDVAASPDSNLLVTSPSEDSAAAAIIESYQTEASGLVNAANEGLVEPMTAVTTTPSSDDVTNDTHETQESEVNGSIDNPPKATSDVLEKSVTDSSVTALEDMSTESTAARENPNVDAHLGQDEAVGGNKDNVEDSHQPMTSTPTNAEILSTDTSTSRDDNLDVIIESPERAKESSAELPRVGLSDVLIAELAVSTPAVGPEVPDIDGQKEDADRPVDASEDREVTISASLDETITVNPMIASNVVEAIVEPSPSAQDSAVAAPTESQDIDTKVEAEATTTKCTPESESVTPGGISPAADQVPGPKASQNYSPTDQVQKTNNNVLDSQAKEGTTINSADILDDSTEEAASPKDTGSSSDAEITEDAILPQTTSNSDHVAEFTESYLSIQTWELSEPTTAASSEVTTKALSLESHDDPLQLAVTQVAVEILEIPAAELEAEAVVVTEDSATTASEELKPLAEKEIGDLDSVTETSGEVSATAASAKVNSVAQECIGDVDSVTKAPEGAEVLRSPLEGPLDDAVPDPTAVSQTPSEEAIEAIPVDKSDGGGANPENPKIVPITEADDELDQTPHVATDAVEEVIPADVLVTSEIEAYKQIEILGDSVNEAEQAPEISITIPGSEFVEKAQADAEEAEDAKLEEAQASVAEGVELEEYRDKIKPSVAELESVEVIEVVVNNEPTQEEALLNPAKLSDIELGNLAEPVTAVVNEPEAPSPTLAMLQPSVAWSALPCSYTAQKYASRRRRHSHHSSTDDPASTKDSPPPPTPLIPARKLPSSSSGDMPRARRHSESFFGVGLFGSSPKAYPRPKRTDSGFSADVDSPKGKEREITRGRSPREQAEHDHRKTERRARRAAEEAAKRLSTTANVGSRAAGDSDHPRPSRRQSRPQSDEKKVKDTDSRRPPPTQYKEIQHKKPSPPPSKRQSKVEARVTETSRPTSTRHRTAEERARHEAKKLERTLAEERKKVELDIEDRAREAREAREIEDARRVRREARRRRRSETDEREREKKQKKGFKGFLFRILKA